MIRVGSLFAGIGGFDVGISAAFPTARTIWHVEQDAFCQSILRKHWPESKIFDDVRTVGSHNLDPVDILLGGFPCQDISKAGRQRGINENTKSGLWWEMHRIIKELRPRIAIMENVGAIRSVGGSAVVGSLADIGYCAEWNIIRASEVGAPHLRRRWFCVAYPRDLLDQRSTITDANSNRQRASNTIQSRRAAVDVHATKSTFWRQFEAPAAVCRVDDGISRKLDKSRIKALGNAIVPQCAEWIGLQVRNSGLLDDLL